MEQSKHVIRMLFLLILVLIGFHILRTLFTPKSFGKYGHFRADNVEEQMVRPVMHGGSNSCAPCHEDKSGDVRAGKHGSVECEVCHAPLATHIKDGAPIAKMLRFRSASLCLRCHDSLDARPTGFPQIRVDEHLRKGSVEMSPDVCMNCHDPHSPRLGG
jgi:predicted CXXCH cytochrome family protein